MHNSGKIATKQRDFPLFRGQIGATFSFMMGKSDAGATMLRAARPCRRRTPH